MLAGMLRMSLVGDGRRLNPSSLLILIGLIYMLVMPFRGGVQKQNQ